MKLLIASALLLAAPALPPAAAPIPATPREVERDVPYVPTPEPVVRAMLELAGVGKADFHVDLGCGDGRIAVAAARDFGARSLGVEIDPKRIGEARRLAEREGVADRAEFRRADLFGTDLTGATVVTLYLLPAVNMRLRPAMLALKPGARVVSHDFDMGDWPPDRSVRLPDEGSTVYLWIVPANVAGRWRVTGPGGAVSEVRLEQRFQRLSGDVRDGRVAGDRVSFTLPDGRRLAGRAAGEAMEGEGWRAERVGD